MAKDNPFSENPFSKPEVICMPYRQKDSTREPIESFIMAALSGQVGWPLQRQSLFVFRIYFAMAFS